MRMKVMASAVGCVVLCASLMAHAQATNTFPASGNVGIGTTSPVRLLDIEGFSTNGAYTPVLRVGVTGPTYGYSGAAIEFSESNNNGGIMPVAALSTSLTDGAPGVQSGDLVLSTSDNGTVTEKMRLESGGNVGIGTASPGAKLEVDGNIKLTAGSGASITFADGSVQSTAYTGVACGGDYAESVDVRGKNRAYEPGDVLVISGSDGSDVELSSQPYSTMVAGIYSTKPGYVGRRQTTKSRAREIPMAMVGIVPTKVTAENGPIHRGDLLVTSSTPGYAMKGTDRSRMLGAVVGKAMGNLNSGKGVIEVLVTLQ